MSFFDDLKSAASNIPGVNAAANAAQQVEGTIMPVELQNLEKTQQSIQQQIANFGQNSENNDSVVQLRTYLMSHYDNLRQGGEPLPVPVTAARIKVMPQYTALIEGYPQLEAGMAALERDRLHGTYGYQMADASIVVPDIHWTTEQLNQVRSQAKDQMARCWLDADPMRYA